MSFLKIKDPEKRELMVKEFLATKKNIQQSQLHERVGEREFQRDLGKFFKPVTDVQKAAAEEIKEELKEITPAFAALPGPPVIPALPGPFSPELSPSVSPEPTSDVNKTNLGPIASAYLINLGAKSRIDKTFGLRSQDGKFYIGDAPVEFDGNNIKVGGRKFKGTEGFWELLMFEKPIGKITPDELTEYGKLLFHSNSIFQNNDPGSNRPKSSGGNKYVKYVAPIWAKRHLYGYFGKGLSDPNKLLERLDLLIESKKAGNTGVQNEIISICGKLKKQNILNSKEYKKIVTKC